MDGMLQKSLFSRHASSRGLCLDLTAGVPSVTPFDTVVLHTHFHGVSFLVAYDMLYPSRPHQQPLATWGVSGGQQMHTTFTDTGAC